MMPLAWEAKDMSLGENENDVPRLGSEDKKPRAIENDTSRPIVNSQKQ
ncbi:hypothetical protein [Bacillus sp. AK031]